MKRLFDLRFVIGLFFLVISLLLILYGVIYISDTEKKINLYAGLFFLLFALTMLFVSTPKNRQFKT